ncbi:putative AgrB-like protein [compost metagenome]
MEQICSNIANNLSSKLNLSEQDTLTLAYGLHLVWDSITKTLILFLGGAMLGFGKEVVITYCLLAFFRAFMGGVHLGSYMSCLITHSIILFVILFGASNLDINIYLLILSYLLGLLSIMKYVPRGTEYRPIVSKREKKRFKLKALTVLIVTFIISFFIPIFYRNVLVLSLVITIIFLLPITYKLFNVTTGEITITED